MEEELCNTIQEFEDIFGNVPFKDLDKIKKHIKNNFIPILLIEKKIQKYNDILEYAETEEGLAEIKDFEYDEAKYGKKILQELLDERNNTDE